MTYMVGDYRLDLFGVPDLHLRSQEHPPKSIRVPEKYPVFDTISHVDILDVDEGFNTNPVLNIR